MEKEFKIMTKGEFRQQKEREGQSIQIIDDYITLKEQLALHKYVMDSKFPYRIYNTHIVEDGQERNEFFNRRFHAPRQFSHHLYMVGEQNSSPHLNIIRPIFDRMKADYGQDVTLLRAKVNMTNPYPPYMKHEPQMPHVDMKYDNGDPVDHMVLLYYINDSDGPTYFFNESYDIVDSVKPKMGRAIVFHGSQLHAGSNPAFYPYRLALNINFTTK